METVLRVLFVYAFLMVAFRLLGKRELSQLSAFELVTLLLIPELFQQALVREDFSMTNGVVAATTLFGIVFLTSVLSHRSPPVQKILSGQPAVLVHRGKFVEENMNRERVPPAEVFGEMHKAGLERLAQVRWAILEEDGQIAVVPADPEDRQAKNRDAEAPV